MYLLAVLSILGCSIYLGLGAYAILSRRRSRLHQVFALLTLSFALWALCYSFIVSVPSKHQVWFWYRLSALSWTLGPALLFHFFLLITGSRHNRAWVLALAYGPQVVFLALALFDTVYAVDFVHTPWGWDEVVDVRRPASLAYTVHLSVLLSLSLWIIFRWSRTADDWRHRMQGRIIFLAGAPVMLLACVSNVALRLLDLHVMPGLAPVVLPLWGCAILYAILKVDLLQLSPERASAQILATMPDALLLLDGEGVVATANPAAQHLFAARGAVVGQHLDQLLGSEASVSAAGLMGRVKFGPLNNVDATFVGLGTQRVRHLSLSASEVRGEPNQPIGMVVILRDVTERKALEQRLLQSAKMEAVGQLAGGLAHDFNNILAVILAESQLLRHCGPVPDDVVEGSINIEHSAKRASQLTRQLLAISRGSPRERTAVDLHATVEEVRAVLMRTLPKQIEIQVRLDADAPQVEGDAGQLHQLLLNLCLNARDAMMPRGGVLGIRTATRQQHGKRVVRLSVTDDGEGMDEPTRQRIFEPFFTTKETSKGAGMGLAMVYSIVKAHGGAIRVRSEPGQGATFEVELGDLRDVGGEASAESSSAAQASAAESSSAAPVAAPPAPAAESPPGEADAPGGRVGEETAAAAPWGNADAGGTEAEPRGAERQSAPQGAALQAAPAQREAPQRVVPAPGAVRAPASGGRGHVLVVDDEAMLRSSSRALLTRAGFEVTTAEDGLEAVDCYREAAGEIDVVLLDMMMPRMGGADCAEALRALDPDARLLLVSGYAPDGAVEQVLQSGGAQFMHKPFDAAELLERVEQLVQERRQSGLRAQDG